MAHICENNSKQASLEKILIAVKIEIPDRSPGKIDNCYEFGFQKEKL